MKLRPVLALALVVALSAGALVAAEKSVDPEAKRALHALNRLTFGPRPGEVEKVRALGVEKWIELQLNPQKLDDSALAARLKPYSTLAMSPRELVENFPPPQLLQAVAQGRAPMPSDPNQRAIYETQIAAYKARQARQTRQGRDQQANGDDEMAMSPAERRQARMFAELKVEEIAALPPEQRIPAILKLTPEERAAVGRAVNREDRQRLVVGMTPEQRRTLMAMGNPRAVILGEMQSAKLLRAAYSERQLEEVMADFWFNHFNVFDRKGAEPYLLGEYEREAIRPHALGKFRDLLLATAKSPAMLFYLDNWQSVGPNSEFAQRAAGMGARAGDQAQRPRAQQQQRRGGVFGRRGRLEGRRGQRQPDMQDPEMQQRRQQAQQRRSGLNENYAREVMELHTLGVDGGYTQQDVTELAKVLTGWTIRQPRQGGGYQFNARMHEPGSKVVLGRRFSDNGEREGEEALLMLARHPSTAKFIARKLALRFVSDDPPPALVDRMAQTFQRTDGDIREVLRTLFRAPEFWAAETYRAKVKTPFEFVVSAARATSADVREPMALAQALNKMGMPLYGSQPPTGYAMTADAWVNSAALLNRLNFALALGTGRLPGVGVDVPQLFRGAPAATPEQALGLLEQALLAGDVSPQTHATIQKQLADPQVTGVALDDAPRAARAGVIAGLILGSPEFQRR